MSKPVELLQNSDGKLSRTALMFLVWMVFLMTNLSYVTFSTKKISDLPDAYVYLTLVLAGTYTARRFLDSKYPPPANTATTPTIPTE